MLPLHHGHSPLFSEDNSATVQGIESVLIYGSIIEKFSRGQFVLLGLPNFSALPLTFAVVVSRFTKVPALFVLSIPSLSDLQCL